MHEKATSARLKAHAKVNLFLAVGDRRADGYHDVTTVLQALELSDDLEVESAGSGVTLVCDPDPGVAHEENLAHRAAVAWFRRSGLEPAVRIRLRKSTPVGAGLGGGSSDAAAVLAALAGFDPADGTTAPDELVHIAAGLGADVPFFLGPGTRLMSGRGDEPVEVLPTPSLDIVLVNPGVPVATGEAYARFDRMLKPAPRTPDAMVDALRAGDPAAVAAALYDNMTEASSALVPEIGGALRFLRGHPGVLGSEMAGSGSTVFGVCTDAGAARACAESARERGWWSCATHSVSAGITWLGGSADMGAQR